MPVPDSILFIAATEYCYTFRAMGVIALALQIGGHLRRSHKVVVREIAGQTLLIPLSQTGADLQRIFVLNDTAAAVWKLLADPHTGEQLVDALRQEYETSEDVIRADTESLLQDLLARNLVALEGCDE